MLASIADGCALASTALIDHSAGGGVDVDLNWTFGLQIVFFLVLFALLKPLLFTPMLKLFEERERRIDGAKNEAREMYREADEKMAKYEEELTAVKRQAGEERDKLRAEGTKKEQAILAKVRAETNAMLEEGRKRIASEGEQMRKELDAAAQTLARDIATRVLGREVQ
jgi:F-type H+-transporting ATPase subunit b